MATLIKNLNQNRTLRQIAFLFGVMALMALFNSAQASTGSGGGMPYEGWLGSLRDSMTGPVAFTGATLGIVASGLALVFGGEISGFIKSMLYLVLVMCLLIGVQNMLAFFGGNGAQIAAVTHYLTIRVA